MISHFWKNIKIIIAIIFNVNWRQPLISIFCFSEKYSKFRIYRWRKKRKIPALNKINIKEVKLRVNSYNIYYFEKQINKKHVREFSSADSFISPEFKKIPDTNNDNIKIYIHNLKFYEHVKSKLISVREYTFQEYSQDIAFPRLYKSYVVDIRKKVSKTVHFEDQTQLIEQFIEKESVVIEKPGTEEPPQIHEPEDQASSVEEDAPTVTERTAKPRKKPPKYQPPIRTPEATQRTRSAQRTGTDNSHSQERSLPMHVHLALLRRNRYRISLLPSRAADFDEEIEVNGPNGKEEWSACQDEWYSNIFPENIGVLLEKGKNWEAGKEDESKRRWVLSSREIYVLAPCSTISGFVSSPRLILYEDHIVLCTKRQEEFVKNALTKAGCSETAIISGNNGLPKGWVLFHSVCPTCPVEHDEAVGIINILRPIHDLEIILGGGIRLTYNTWINGYPPNIRIRGAKDDNLKVMIDGNEASADADGIYTAEGWDSPGAHNVFCGGVTESYELSDGLQHWEGFEAFEYCLDPQQTSKQYVTICGPIVGVNNEMSEAVLTPSSNAHLLGAIPGQIAFCPRQQDTRTSEYIAIADFPVTWTLPANPFQCDKSTSCVKLIRAKKVASAQISIFSRDEILRWSYAILNASRKRLRIEPDTGEAKKLWTEYKQEARRLWKQLK